MSIDTIYIESRYYPVCGNLLFFDEDMDGQVIRCRSCNRRWTVLRSGATEPQGPHPNLNTARTDPSDASFREAA